MLPCSIFLSVLLPERSHPLAVWSSCLSVDHLQIYIMSLPPMHNLKNTPPQIMLAGLSAPNPHSVQHSTSDSFYCPSFVFTLLTQLYPFYLGSKPQVWVGFFKCLFLPFVKAAMQSCYFFYHHTFQIRFILSTVLWGRSFWNVWNVLLLSPAYGFPKCCVWNSCLSSLVPFLIPSVANWITLTLCVTFTVFPHYFGLPATNVSFFPHDLNWQQRKHPSFVTGWIVAAWR